MSRLKGGAHGLQLDREAVMRIAEEAASNAARAAVRETLAAFGFEAANEPRAKRPVLERKPPPPAFLSVKAAARVLRVRSITLSEILTRELEAGREIPGEDRTKGNRRHLRLDPDRLLDWWAEVNAEGVS